MDKREKVIKGFTCCDGAAVHLGHCQEDCPYFGESERADKCVEKLYSDALSLLKAQEPRVMTLEEASFRLGEPVWVEEKAPDAVYCEVLFDVDGKAFNLTFGNIEFGGLLTGHSLFSVEPYGRDFRFWTSRPTEEQRRETAWTDQPIEKADDPAEGKFSGLIAEE